MDDAPFSTFGDKVVSACVLVGLAAAGIAYVVSIVLWTTETIVWSVLAVAAVWVLRHPCAAILAALFGMLGS